MKKFTYIAFASTAALALAACGSADDASVEAEADNVEIPADTAMDDIAEDDVPVADPDAMVATPVENSAADAAAAVEAEAEDAGAAAAAAAADVRAAAKENSTTN